MRRAVVIAIAAVLLAGISSGDAPAAEPSPTPAAPVSAVAASAPATVDPAVATDVISVYTARQLDDTVANAAITAAMNAGGVGLELNGGVLGLLAVHRGGAALQQAAAGFRWPLSMVVMPPEAAGHIVNRQVARVLALGQVVMAQTTATMHGVQAGDVLTLLGWDGAPHDVLVGLVTGDDVTGGSELMISPALAQSMGVARPSSVAIWGFRSRAEIDQQLAANGLVAGNIRIRRSWDPPDPDALLSYPEIKSQLGEFQISSSGTSMIQEPGWAATHIARVSLPLGIRANCHVGVIPALQGALNEVAADGLGGAIDVPNTNTYGGCFGLGEISPLGSTTGGFVSRHSWGMAIDMNTIENPEGSPPTMNCDVVRIFRKWGFAWGGNFLQGDGMHFEWVGHRRDQLPYPSRYCPNIVTAPAATTSSTAAASGRLQLFANEDGQ